MARGPFKEYPVRLGDRGMRTVPMIGSTPNALNLPRVHFDPKSNPEQHMADISANFAAIQRVVNNLPVPTVGTGFIDVVDGFRLRSSGTGIQTFQIEEILADQGYEIKAGIWHVLINARTPEDGVPDGATGGELFVNCGSLPQVTNKDKIGSPRGVWNGDDSKGWDTPRFESEERLGRMHVFASSFEFMKDTGTSSFCQVDAHYWILNEAGTLYDPFENGSPLTTMVDASWEVQIGGYRVSDERFNEQTLFGDESWPDYEI